MSRFKPWYQKIPTVACLESKVHKYGIYHIFVGFHMSVLQLIVHELFISGDYLLGLGIYFCSFIILSGLDKNT